MVVKKNEITIKTGNKLPSHVRRYKMSCKIHFCRGKKKKIKYLSNFVKVSCFGFAIENTQIIALIYTLLFIPRRLEMDNQTVMC